MDFDMRTVGFWLLSAALVVSVGLAWWRVGEYAAYMRFAGAPV